jgi:hypothetical protein
MQGSWSNQPYSATDLCRLLQTAPSGHGIRKRLVQEAMETKVLISL